MKGNVSYFEEIVSFDYEIIELRGFRLTLEWNFKLR